MDNIPIHVPVIFTAVVVATFGFLYYAFDRTRNVDPNNSQLIFAGMAVIWLLLTGIMATSGFVRDFESLPPKFLLVIVPPTLATILLLLIPKTRAILRNIPIATITYIHIIRVPVELVIWWLFLEGYMPKIMSFEGLNFDIISGITAPFAAIFLLRQGFYHRKSAIVWNIIALSLLIAVVYHALLSVPFPFQQYGFDQPNRAVFYLPYIWLPGFVVPAVFFSHLVSLVQLLSPSSNR
jgi:hypothetical protein